MGFLEFFLYLCRFNIIVQAGNILPVPSHVNAFQKCIKKIEGGYFKQTDLIIFLNSRKSEDLRLSSRPFIMQTNYTEELKPFPLQKVDAYVLIISQEHLADIFEYLSKPFYWNPRAKFVIVYEGKSVSLFKVLKRYYVFDVVVLVPSLEDAVDVFTYFPYNYSVDEDERNNPVLLDVCVGGELQQNVDLFPKKLPESWNNTSVRLILINYPPYVIKDDADAEKYPGMEREVLKLVQQIIGFKIEYVNKTYAAWGTKQSDGSYDEAYGDLQNQNADMAIGHFYTGSDEIWDFDLAYPYMDNTAKWVTPSPKLIARWQSIVRIFRLQLWLAVVILVIVVAILLCWMARIFSDIKKCQDLLNCFLICSQYVLAQSGQISPRTGSIRFFLITWVVFGWVISTIFQSHIMAALNFDTYSKPMTTVQEMIDSKIAFGFHKVIAVIYSSEDDNLDSYIFKNCILCNLSDACLNRTAFQRDFATVKSYKLLQYITHSYYVDSNGKPLFSILEGNAGSVLITITFSKGFPLYEQVNKLLLNVRSAGFINFSDRKIKVDFNMGYTTQVRQTADVLEFKELRDIFLMLLIGLLLGFIAFVGELVSNSNLYKN